MRVATLKKRRCSEGERWKEKEKEKRERERERETARVFDT